MKHSNQSGRVTLSRSEEFVVETDLGLGLGPECLVFQGYEPELPAAWV